MEEDYDIRWGYLEKLVDKIADQEERLGGWDELIDMLADIFTEALTVDDKTAFTLYYGYLFRLYYRLRGSVSHSDFNQVRVITKSEKMEDRAFYEVTNYNFNMYKWAVDRGFTELLSNTSIQIPKSELSPAEIRRFNKQISTPPTS